MAFTFPWMTGNHITLVQFIIQLVGLDGQLTDGVNPATDIATLVQSGGTLAGGNLTFSVGLLDEVTDFGGSVDMENISPTNRGISHNVLRTVGMAFSVSEILARGSNSQQLAKIAFNGSSKIARFRYARAQAMHSLYCVITGYDEEVTQGRSTGRLSLGPVAAGAATYGVTLGVDNP